ncbi:MULTISPECIES: hypothetical protein [unclassified Janthinobacterium]|nr:MULTISPECIES: hypothetical protein [unclassified Janthinobacterium]MBB5367485.1 hypothetical protein [Janthinobacterium sp. K2C7]MBB5380037.1 hypothetical protein [Janthinobacterium sp. K2Li3]MBB5385867.1 hypothetical protein [Janthinobacterium sp. K2E3]
MSLNIAGISCLAAAMVGLRYLVKHQQWQLHVDVRRWRSGSQ